jgi:Xaa-Pro aminopeptidase
MNRKWADELTRRTDAVREEMRRRKLDALVLTSEANVRYVSGFTGSESAVLLGKRSLVLVTDFRYVEEAEQTCPFATVRTHRRGLMQAAGAEARRRRMRRVGFDPGGLSVRAAKLLRGNSGSAKLLSRSGIVEKVRQYKAPLEVKAIRHCLGIAEKAYRSFWKRLKPGMTETDAAAELEYIMRRRLGAQGPSFETIVAFDEHASQPHAKPDAKKLRNSSIVLVDWGARAGFYNCDLTRTTPIGRIPRKFSAVRDIVLEAQRRAIGAMRPGVPFRAVDAVARDFIASEGYGRAFGHGLGHGVGLEIHEAPSLSERSKGRLEQGMVVTVEPGIYLPGEFGVRIEDMVLVTNSGAEVLSRLPRD